MTPEAVLFVMRFPGRFEYVAVGVEELHADVVRLVPLLHDVNTIGAKAISEGPNSFRTRKVNPKVEERRQADRFVTRSESEREAVRVVEHENVTVITARWPRIEAEV
jgi:hypothetical protein